MFDTWPEDVDIIVVGKESVSQNATFLRQLLFDLNALLNEQIHKNNI